MLTGREARTLPPAVVRGLFWRVYAQRLWDRNIVTLAGMPLPPSASLDSRIAKGEAVTALRAIEAVLFPEDDDDGE